MTLTPCFLACAYCVSSDVLLDVSLCGSSSSFLCLASPSVTSIELSSRIFAAFFPWGGLCVAAAFGWRIVIMVVSVSHAAGVMSCTWAGYVLCFRTGVCVLAYSVLSFPPSI